MTEPPLTAELKQLYEARVESEQRYRSLIANMLEGVACCELVYDAQGEPVDFIYLTVNAAFERLSGLSGVVGKRVSEVIPGVHETSPGLIAAYARVAATGIPETFEFEFKALGQWRKISVYSQSPATIVAMFEDITERKRLESERALQAAALNSSADPILITTRDGTIAWANGAFAASSGYTLDEVIGRNPRALVKSGAQDEAFYAALWRTVLAGNVWKGELVNRRKDGTVYPEFLTITPVRGEDGEVSHFVAVKRDLTNEKKLQGQFLQSQKMESVGRLAGGVAHDFNNLLMVMNGWTEMALEDLPSDHAVRKSLEAVLAAGLGAASLTRQLLAFSRQQVVEPEIFRVDTLVAGMEKMLRRLLGEDVRLATRAGPETGFVKMDRGQLEQALMNLAVNARDAMPQGGALLIETSNVVLTPQSLRPHQDIVPGDYVVLEVSDTGTGMTDSVREHLFEPFFTTKELGKGTGLGLATTYGIIRQAGGFVDVSSVVGAGTTMRLLLPRTYAIAPTDDWHVRRTPRVGVETILLVEDEVEVRKVMERMLSSRGYRVLCAASGDEAFATVEASAEPVHLLITDIVLAGGTSGSQLAARLAAERPGLKVLYVSGYTTDVTVLHGVMERETALLQKPFAAEALSAKVRQILDGE